MEHGFWALGFQSFRLPGSRAQAQQLCRTVLAAPRHVESPWTRDQTHVSCTGRRILYPWSASFNDVLKLFFYPVRRPRAPRTRAAMMPVGAGGGGGFLRGQPAKPPSSRASRPPGALASSAGRAGGEGSGLAGAPGLGAPPPRAGRWGGAGCQRGLSRGSGDLGSGGCSGGRRGRGSGGGGSLAGAPSAASAALSCRAFAAGLPGRGSRRWDWSRSVPPSPPRPSWRGSFSARPVSGSRGASVPPHPHPTPPEICWCRIWSRQCGHPRVVFPRWKPTFLRSPFSDF